MSKAEFGTKEDYLRALRAIQKTEGMVFLWEHFKQPDHTTTWEHLAKVTGYDSYRDINSRYGTFARSVAHQLGVTEKPTDTQGNKWWLWVLVDWSDKDAVGYQKFALCDEVLYSLGQMAKPS